MTRADKRTIGIIGGGQLGQMMAIAAQYMGHTVITLDPNPNCSASKVSDQMIVAAYDDQAAIKKLAQACGVLTYEFENVDAAALDAVKNLVDIPQGTDLLRITQNRIAEKTFLKQAGFKIAPYQVIRSAADLPEHFVGQRILKTTTEGYDGHGQVVVNSEEKLVEARQLADVRECVLEEVVDFVKEISVLVSGNGTDFVTLPVAENIHQHSILHETIAPARIAPEIAENARQIALEIAEKLHLAGTLGVEMFLSADGTIFVNELAPRPHNSGHYSIEACDFNQFDLHIKGILGEKLPQPELLRPAIMLNVLGQHVAALQHLPEVHENWHFHDYGKEEAKQNRKMGHITILTNDFAETLREIDATKIW